MNFLGLIQRAGKLVSGFDGVKLGLIRHQLKVVVIAQDASSNTRDKIDALLKHNPDVKVIDSLTSTELSSALGKKRKLVGITDKGFSKALIKKMNEEGE